MLTNLNVLIIGGDARYVEVIHRLSGKGAKVFLIGFNQVDFEEPNVSNTTLDELDFSILDAISLPILGTNEVGKVESMYSDYDVFFKEEMIRKTPEHCVIYTGTSNSFLEDLAESNNRKLKELFADDDTAIINSIPTAEGVLKLAIDHRDLTIHGSNVMVLGFGRVGMTVARLFSSVGASVRVCVRKSADIARIAEMGLIPLPIDNLQQEVSNMDICINTIPAPIIDANVISVMKKSTLIIDITSSPGGTDFDYAAKQGVKALHALGLPGKTAPRTAGRIIADALANLMMEYKI